MPKQIYKIDQFHGGLSTNSDPRDIAENELSAVTDMMVDGIGKIRPMGGLASHVSTAKALAMNSGYGLFYYSHDRFGGNLPALDFTGIHTAGVNSITVDAAGSGYSPAPDVAIGANGGSGAAATASIDHAGRVTSIAVDSTGSGYTSAPPVSFYGGGSGSGAAATAVMQANEAVLDDTSASFPVDGLIGATIYNQSDGSSAVITDNTSTTVTGTLAGGTGNNWNVGDVYNITFPAIGDDYLAFADTDASADIAIYSRTTNTWVSSIIDLGATTGMKPTFYVVDGALRVSDGNFGSTNENKWYGYIDRTLFSNSTNYDIDSWSVEKQKIYRPTYSRLRNQLLDNGMTYSVVNDDVVGGSVQHYTVDDDGSLGNTNVSRITISWSAVSTNSERGYEGNFEIKAGGYNGSNFTGTTRNGSANFVSMDSYDTDTGDIVITFNSAGPDIDVSTAEADDPQKVRVQMMNINEEEGVGTLKITNVKYEKVSGTPAPHTNLGVDNVEVEVEMDVPAQHSDAHGWGKSATIQWKWNVGVSFIYDEKQESLIRELEDVYTGTITDIDSDTQFTVSPAQFIASDLIGETAFNTTDNSYGTVTANTTTLVTLDDLVDGFDNSWDGATTNANGGDGYSITKTTVAAISTQSPTIKFSLEYSSNWNKRITGAKLYMRKSQGNEPSDWYHQITYDFIKGKATVRLNGYEQDVVYDGSLNEYSWEIPREKLQQPNLVSSYLMETGHRYDEESIMSKYKTSTVVNRIAYIGGLEVQKEDGNIEIMGDAMIKSPPNKFDLFPLSNIIEASVRDGDEIVKLEEYADRILQFKKHKMHLINVSQDVEFLEGTFMFKGVSHPAATCKTDYGVAWVNKNGCYLYDGETVKDLLERKGVKLIDTGEWSTDFVTDNSTIGYIPLKRQIIVLKDCSATSVGDIYLYDIITQSWVFGNSKIIDTQIKSNFVNDWNGDLVCAHTSSTGTMVKWDDAPDTSTTIDIKTKDIDFGQPAQRKKIYKVYVTHRGSTSNIQTSYAINGDQDTYTEFPSTGTELPASSAVTDWVTTELSLSVSSCYSIRLRFFSDGTTPANFEINDISIVFRVKPVK